MKVRSSRKTLLVNHMRAPQDANGNPRRVFVVQDTRTGNVIDTIDEGYRGIHAWRTLYPNAVEGAQFDVSPAEYRSLRKLGQGKA